MAIKVEVDERGDLRVILNAGRDAPVWLDDFEVAVREEGLDVAVGRLRAMWFPRRYTAQEAELLLRPFVCDEGE